MSDAPASRSVVACRFAHWLTVSCRRGARLRPVIDSRPRRCTRRSRGHVRPCCHAGSTRWNPGHSAVDAGRGQHDQFLRCRRDLRPGARSPTGSMSSAPRTAWPSNSLACVAGKRFHFVQAKWGSEALSRAYVMPSAENHSRHWKRFRGWSRAGKHCFGTRQLAGDGWALADQKGSGHRETAESADANSVFNRCMFRQGAERVMRTPQSPRERRSASILHRRS